MKENILKIFNFLFLKKSDSPKKDDVLILTKVETLYILKERAIKLWEAELRKQGRPSKRKILLEALKP